MSKHRGAGPLPSCQPRLRPRPLPRRLLLPSRPPDAHHSPRWVLAPFLPAQSTSREAGRREQSERRRGVQGQVRPTHTPIPRATSNLPPWQGPCRDDGSGGCSGTRGQASSFARRAKRQGKGQEREKEEKVISLREREEEDERREGKKQGSGAPSVPRLVLEQSRRD